MKTLILTLCLLFVSSNLMATAHRLDSGLYEIEYSREELCAQRIRSLYDERGILKGIYVRYQGMCGDMGPYYYYCNEKGITNECYNINHRFKIIRDNVFFWENETVNAFGIFYLAE